jgi:hypothetical protein
LPNLSHAAVLFNSNNGSHRLQLKDLEAAAAKLNMRLEFVPVVDAGALDAALDAAV